MKMSDLRKTPAELMEQHAPVLGPVDEYPCGTSISLDEQTLGKLGADHEDWSVGDIFKLVGMWRITSVSENETTQGKRKCVTLQALMLGAEEEPDSDED